MDTALVGHLQRIGPRKPCADARPGLSLLRDGLMEDCWCSSGGSRGFVLKRKLRAASGRSRARRWTALAALAAMRAPAQTLLELRAQTADASDGADDPISDLPVEPG